MIQTHQSTTSSEPNHGVVSPRLNRNKKNLRRGKKKEFPSGKVSNRFATEIGVYVEVVRPRGVLLCGKCRCAGGNDSIDVDCNARAQSTIQMGDTNLVGEGYFDVQRRRNRQSTIDGADQLYRTLNRYVSSIDRSSDTTHIENPKE
jgi:hypothetical protein